MSDQTPGAEFLPPRSPRIGLWLAAAAGIAAVLVAGVFTLKNGWAVGAREISYVRSFTPGKPVTGGYVGWVGAKITVGSEAVVVTRLGRIAMSENSRTHTLKLVEASTGKDLPGASVEISMAGQPLGKFVYGTLSAPVRLSPKASYYLVSSESLGRNVGDFFNDYDSKVATTDVAQVDHAIFREGNEWRPLGSKNEMFGPVDFKYRP
jgi:hypothetical protein